MLRRFALAAVGVSLVVAACNGGDGPTLVTEIVRFEANAERIERGSSVRLEWEVRNPGTHGSAMSCSMTRRFDGEPAQTPFAVDCQSSLEEVPAGPGEATYVRYQLSALKLQRDEVDPYLTAVVTVALEDPDRSTLTIEPAGSGRGNVRSDPAGIDLDAGDVSAGFVDGTVVTLTAAAAAGSTFAGWGGGCEGAARTCSVTLTSDTTVTATFDLVVHSLTIERAGNGRGNVTSDPAGIDLDAGDASAEFADGTVVTLTAAAAVGSSFAGWDGGCEDAGSTCSFALTSETTLTATFDFVAPMRLEVDTNLIPGTTVTVPLRGSVDVSIDWGDGTVNRFTYGGNMQHTYAIDGRYTIGISGSLSHFGAALYPNAGAIIGVQAWGEIGLTSLSHAFDQAGNLTFVPTTVPGTVTNMSYMFAGASTFNQRLASWGTGSVTDMSYMFSNASVFDQPIETWDTSSVTSMRAMFVASAFNQPIGGWDTGTVTDMSYMFSGASAFNQPIGAWDTSRVIDMTWLFSGASAFNQPIEGWDTSRVTHMSGMLRGASAFNRPIGSWNTSNVSSMSSMFSDASAFNQDLSGWCVANIASRPWNFDDGATSWTLPRPVWGTCPE